MENNNTCMTEELLNIMDRVNGAWLNAFKVYHSDNEVDLLLEKYIRADIRQMLNERNTINTETDKVATEISRAICNKNLVDSDVRKKKNNIKAGSNNDVLTVNEYQFSVNAKYNNANVLCTVVFYEFPSEEEYDKYFDEQRNIFPAWGTSSSFRGRSNFMNIYVCKSPTFISYPDVFDTVQHELTHLSKNIITRKDMEDDNFNAFINNIMRNPNPDHYLKLIADICYICKKDEQDACINGAYAYLKQQMPLDGSEIMRKLLETYLYDRIKFLKMTMEKLPTVFNDVEFDDVLKEIPQQFNITKSKLKGWVHHGLNRLERKTTNMLTNYEKYLYNCNYHSKFPQTPLGGI